MNLSIILSSSTFPALSLLGTSSISGNRMKAANVSYIEINCNYKVLT